MRYIKAFLLVAGMSLLTSCSTPTPAGNGPQAAIGPQFNEADAADFIARYYSDTTSYALKPPRMDGAYQTICDRPSLLKLAAEQPRRELAVIVLIHYPGVQTEETTKLAWVNDLKALGYKRIVFVRGGNNIQVNGLPILESPQASAAPGGK